MLLWSCGGSPTTPTPPRPAPSLTCPDDIDAIAENGVSVPVSYSLPPIQGGTPPLTLACSPASGSSFAVGDSVVTCTVTDATQRTATCQFRVRVAAELRLTRTRFLAFGDSITEGKIATATLALTLVGPGFSYPAQLRTILQDRYEADEIVVVNAGVGGETTEAGRIRLPGAILEHPSDVLLLQEGTNRINRLSLSTQLFNLRGMVRTARSAGMDVLIATVLPISEAREARHPGTLDRIVALNTGIVGLAQQEGIGPAVDLFSAFEGRPSLLSADGLHPSEEGYRVIAETFAEEIQRRWETGGPPVSTMMLSAGRGAR